MSSRGRLGKLYGARYPANWRALAGQVTRGRRRASSEAPRLGFLDERSLTLWLNPLQKQLVFRCNQIVHAEYPFIVPCPALCLTQLPWVPGTAVRFSFLLQLYEGAEDTCTTVGPPWPDLFRPPTSLTAAPATAGKAWMAGRSPAKGISGCIERAMNRRFRSTGQPRVKHAA